VTVFVLTNEANSDVRESRHRGFIRRSSRHCQCASEIFDQVMSGAKVGRLPCADRQCHYQRRFPHAGQSQEDHGIRLMHEAQRVQLADLPVERLLPSWVHS